MTRLRLWIATLLLIVGLVVVTQPRFVTVQQFYTDPPAPVVRVLFHGCDVLHIQPDGALYALLLRCHVPDGWRRRAVIVRPNALLDVTVGTPVG